MSLLFSPERRAFLKRACQVALLAAGAGCGGSGGSGDNFPTPGRALTPGNTPQTRYRVERLFGTTDASRAGSLRGRSSEPSGWWEYRHEVFGKINNRGEIAAQKIESYSELGPPAIFRGGQFVASGVPAPPEGHNAWDKTFDLNDRGQLLVWHYTYRRTVRESPYGDIIDDEDQLYRLFLSENGEARPIELPYTNIYYAGINNRGHIAGTAPISREQTNQEGGTVSTQYEGVFLWRDGQLEEFGPQGCSVHAINDAGQMLGAIYTGNSENLSARTTLWQNPQTTVDLNFPQSFAMGSALNQEGAVVATLGSYRGYNPPTYLWTPTVTNSATGTATQIGGLPNSFVCEDMNVRRDFVGSAYDKSIPPGPDYYLRAYLMRSGASEADDLNALIPADSGVLLEQAYGINDAGQITCIGRTDPENVRSERAVFLLTPDRYA